MEERKVIAVKEKREKIDKIKKKFKNMSMSDKDANKIRRLEILNNVLKGATTVVGIITAIDLIVPDPILGLDEMALTAITTLLGTGIKVVDNKINSIANSTDSNLKFEEINNLSKDLNRAISSVSSSRKARRM